MDLAYRVPATRERLIKELIPILKKSDFRAEEKLLLSASYIIGEYSVATSLLNNLFFPGLLFCSQRIQISLLTASFMLLLRSKSNEEFQQMSSVLTEKLDLFHTSSHPEVQDLSKLSIGLLEILNTFIETDFFSTFQNILTTEYIEPETQLEVPAEINEPIPIFEKPQTEFIDQPSNFDGQVINISRPSIGNITGEIGKKHKPHKKQRLTAEKPQVIRSRPSSSVISHPVEPPSALSVALNSIDLTAATNSTPQLPTVLDPAHRFPSGPLRPRNQTKEPVKETTQSSDKTAVKPKRKRKHHSE